MTVITGKGLNITAVKNKNKDTEVEECMDTQEDEDLDLQTIQNIHKAKQDQDNKKKQAFGVSHNIFDVSSYGEVRLNDFRPQKEQAIYNYPPN